MTLERRGVPTATFVTDAFADYARGLCRLQGLPALPLVVIPHPVASRPEEELRAKVRAASAELLRALVAPR
jgi:predicted dienelactone hydrolase